MKALVVLAALAGCIHDEYRCTNDSDCNVGDGGRCEPDHHCTSYDPSCATHHRYVGLSGAVSNSCFDDRIAIANVCAPGQPPAQPTGCAATVCAALPACCLTGWSEACVRQAQRTCAPACDTRIAITATKPGATELWDLRWTGTMFTIGPDDGQLALSWLAPVPGLVVPRLTSFDANNTFVVEKGSQSQTSVVLPASHHYVSSASVDLDRDGHDNVVLAWLDAGANAFAEVVKLDVATTMTVRDLPTPQAFALETWGDYDHDAFPDGVAASGAQYTFLPNIEATTDHTRALDATITSVFGGNGTANEPASRGFDFGDVDGNGVLDLVGFGNSLRVHVGGDRLPDRPIANIDCSPPVITGTSVQCDANAQAAVTFSGALLPTGEIIAATSPVRGVYKLVLHTSGVPAIDQPPKQYTFADGCTTGCDPILAVVTRDLDGDHVVDVIAIDAALHVHANLSTRDPPLVLVKHAPTCMGGCPTTTGFNQLRVSVSGQPR